MSTLGLRDLNGHGFKPEAHVLQTCLCEALGGQVRAPLTFQYLRLIDELILAIELARASH